MRYLYNKAGVWSSPLGLGNREWGVGRKKGKGVVLVFVWWYIWFMSVTQTVDIPNTRRITIDVPSEVPTGRVVLTFTPERKSPPAKGSSAFGCLQRFADPSKIPGEKDAWGLAAVEKHAKN